MKKLTKFRIGLEHVPEPYRELVSELVRALLKV